MLGQKTFHAPDRSGYLRYPRSPLRLLRHTLHVCAHVMPVGPPGRTQGWGPQDLTVANTPAASHQGQIQSLS